MPFLGRGDPRGLSLEFCLLHPYLKSKGYRWWQAKEHEEPQAFGIPFAREEQHREQWRSWKARVSAALCQANEGQTKDKISGENCSFMTQLYLNK